MGKRRNSLIILGLVVVLLATSIYVIAKKPTVLGLDLKGGTELVYQGRPTPQVPDVTPEDIDRAIEIIRQRVDSLGVSEPEISRVGGDQIEIGLPNVSNADRAAESVGTTAQLYLYDFEPNVIPPNKSVQDPAERPYNRLYDAVLAASKQKPGLGRAVCEAGVYRERRHLLPLRREHPGADRRPVGEEGRPVRELAEREAAAEHEAARGPAGHGGARGQARGRSDHRRRRVGNRIAVLRPPRQAEPHGRPDHRPEARHRPVQPADGRLQLHRLGPARRSRASPRRSLSAAPPIASPPPARRAVASPPTRPTSSPARSRSSSTAS